VTKWRLTELSLVVHGADSAAHAVRLDDEERVRFAQRIKAAASDRRAAVRSALRLDRWERWSITAAARIAERLGCDLDAVGDALDEEINREVARIVEEVA
jgi:hypothetical protein